MVGLIFSLNDSCCFLFNLGLNIFVIFEKIGKFVCGFVLDKM